MLQIDKFRSDLGYIILLHGISDNYVHSYMLFSVLFPNIHFIASCWHALLEMLAKKVIVFLVICDLIFV